MNARINLPIELYDTLERHFGHVDSRSVANVIKQSLELIENRSLECAEQRKREIIDQMRNELVTREYLHQELELVRKDMELVHKDMEVLRKDMEVLRKDVKADLAQLDKKFSLYFLALLFAVLFVNKDAIALLASLLGLAKP